MVIPPPVVGEGRILSSSSSSLAIPFITILVTLASVLPSCFWKEGLRQSVLLDLSVNWQKDAMEKFESVTSGTKAEGELMKISFFGNKFDQE